MALVGYGCDVNTHCMSLCYHIAPAFWHDEDHEDVWSGFFTSRVIVSDLEAMLA
jgi:hypothetical protein